MSRCNKIVTAPVLALFFVFSFLSPHFAFASSTNGTIDTTSRYAWSENLGWIDFGSSDGAVTITDSVLTGYAWSETTGWISLNCSNTSSCDTVDYKVANNGEGTLSGYAWTENSGWIDFDPTGVGITIDSSGDFAGYAWGENVGWVVFNCSTTSSCDTVNYKVNTDWRPASARPACNNSSDDDGDGKTDYPTDPGCESLTDTSETDTSSRSRSGGYSYGPPVQNPVVTAPLPIIIIEEHIVPREMPVVNDNSKKSPDNSKNSSDTNEESSKTPNEEPPAPLTSRVEVIIVDPNQEPVEGATVTLHSTPRTIVTDEDGRVVFEGVESGPHRLVVNYRGQEGERAINLDESIAEFQFKIQIEATNPLVAKKTLIVLGILALIIAFLIFLLLKKYKRVNY